MRLAHFEALRPVCPHCRRSHQQDHPLKIATVIIGNEQNLVEGVLNCSNPACQLEYPVIDGIPIIVPDIRDYISRNLAYITARNDLSGTIESMLGDCLGPGTPFDADRQYLSTYTWDHYGDLSKPTDQAALPGSPAPGSILSCLSAGLDLLEAPLQSPAIDFGCSVGRTTFELASRCDGLVLGIDLSMTNLRLAQSVLRNEPRNYPLRRIGLVYDQVSLNASFDHSHRVDFWACDALALPIANGTFGLATALNILDSVLSPHDLLLAIGNCLEPSGQAVLACPYDWSPAATPMESWIGGHSQRGETRGSAEPFLKSLLTPGAHAHSLPDLQLTGEIENQQWTLRLHDRSTAVYSTHVIALKKQGIPAV